MRPTRHQLKLEPDERERWRERVCPAALFTLQQRGEMCLPLPVCRDSIPYEKVQRRCLCESDSPIVSPGVRSCARIQCVCVCLLASLAQTILYSLWFSVKKKQKTKRKQAWWITLKAMRYLRDTSSLFDLLPGNDSIFFCSRVQRPKPQAGT